MIEALPLNETIENTRLEALEHVYANRFGQAETLLKDVEGDIGVLYEQHNTTSSMLHAVHRALSERAWGYFKWRQALVEHEQTDPVLRMEDAYDLFHEAADTLGKYVHGDERVWVEGVSQARTIQHIRVQLGRTLLAAGGVVVSAQILDGSIRDQPAAQEDQADVWRADDCVGLGSSDEDCAMADLLVSWTKRHNSSATQQSALQLGSATLQTSGVVNIENKLFAANIGQL